MNRDIDKGMFLAEPLKTPCLVPGVFIPQYFESKMWKKTNWLLQETACPACYQLNSENLDCSRKTWQTSVRPIW